MASSEIVSNTNSNNNNSGNEDHHVPVPATDEEQDGAVLLVSEFPPPPFYYKSASTLTPPSIPTEALELASRRAAAAAAAAQALVERNRQEAQAGIESSNHVLTGETPIEEEEGDVVGVFGEIVEDPLLTPVSDVCENPTVVRDAVQSLNRKVVEGFVKLVHELVHRPLDNKKCRDELSHNIFLMLQECNKFREHQAREVLIETLEHHLQEQQALCKKLKEEIGRADAALEKMQALQPNALGAVIEKSSDNQMDVSSDQVMDMDVETVKIEE